MTEAIESFDVVVAERPEEPPRSSVYFLPLIVGVIGFTVAGWLFGETGWLWGAAGGAALALAVVVARVTRDPVDLAVLIVGSSVGVAVFNAIVDGRSGEITFRISVPAAVGWVIVGAALGWVFFRNSEDQRWPTVLLVALAMGLAGMLSMQWGTEIGYLRTLRISEIEAGVLQELPTAFYTWAAFFTSLTALSVGYSLRVRTPILAALGGAITVTVFTYNAVQFSLGDVVTQITSLGELEEQFNFWPPEWRWAPVVGADDALAIYDPFVETLRIAVVGATIGTTLALPLAFLASRPTAPNAGSYWAAKAFLNVFRTIPDLFWAILFATAVGFGPFAGAIAMVFFSLAIMAKLLSETVDSIDPGPLEAARSTGSTHLQVIRHSAFPQVFPNYVAYALYIFELNIRASVVIGFVGGGGIGRLLNEQRNFFQWDRVMAIVIVIFVAVLLIEFASIAIRRRIV